MDVKIASALLYLYCIELSYSLMPRTSTKNMNHVFVGNLLVLQRHELLDKIE